MWKPIEVGIAPSWKSTSKIWTVPQSVMQSQPSASNPTGSSHVISSPKNKFWTALPTHRAVRSAPGSESCVTASVTSKLYDFGYCAIRQQKSVHTSPDSSMHNDSIEWLLTLGLDPTKTVIQQKNHINSWASPLDSNYEPEICGTKSHEAIWIKFYRSINGHFCLHLESIKGIGGSTSWSLGRSINLDYNNKE